MAFVTTESSALQIQGPKPMLLVFGTYTSSASGTGGVIQAGYTNSSGTLTAVSGSASTGGRKILACLPSPTTEDVTTTKAVISYDTTNDRDQATLTTAANGTGNYVLICDDAGA